MTVGAVQANGGADSTPAAPIVGAGAVTAALRAVELREDVPLKGGARGVGGGGGAPWCAGAGGPRLVILCFAALTAAISLALFTQIYYGDFEVVPHGSVASDAAACSAAGTRALHAGGGALDAAVVAALCLAVLAPHRTSLDASGAMLYWEYRTSRSAAPSAAEWGGASPGQAAAGRPRPPRLVAALAALHAELGVLPWPSLLQPAIDLAKNGFEVSEGLALALATTAARAGDDAASTRAAPAAAAGTLTTAPDLAAYLHSLQMNTSAELSSSWGNGDGAGGGIVLRRGGVTPAAVGARRLYAAGVGAPVAARALARALRPTPLDIDEATSRVLTALQQEARATAAVEGQEDAPWPPPPGGGVATGLAVVDRRDTYISLVTGTSVPFGSGGAGGAGGWRRDEPRHQLDLAPAIMVDGSVCGTRFVLGAESSAALAQAGAALGAGGGAASVERARAAVLPGGALAPEAGRLAPAALGVLAPLAPPAPPPHAAVNVVQQTADALLSHADSRGGGLASRF